MAWILDYSGFPRGTKPIGYLKIHKRGDLLQELTHKVMEAEKSAVCTLESQESSWCNSVE